MHPCTGIEALYRPTAHRGSRGIALLFLDHGTRRGERSASRPGHSFTPGKDPVIIVQEARWAPGPVWTGAENLAATGIRSPDRPARSQSLYRLRYPAHTIRFNIQKFYVPPTQCIYVFCLDLIRNKTISRIEPFWAIT